MTYNTSGCMWPVGDPKDSDFHFCGDQISNRESYCSFHHKLAKLVGVISARAEALNMVVGGARHDRRAYLTRVRDHVRGARKIDPYQWRGWPKPVYDNGAKWKFSTPW